MLVGGVNSTGKVTLSPSEREYIASGVSDNLRADGRGRRDWRTVNAELGPVPQAAGSSRVRIGGTDVMVSVKGDIGRPSLESPSEGVIVCTVDSSTVFTMNAAIGGINEDRQVQQRNEELTAILEDVFITSGSVNLGMLCLVPGKHCWILYIDVLVLDYDGNLIDAMIMAARLALREMRLPHVRIEEGGEATEVILAEDVDTTRIITQDTLPVTVTVGKIGPSFLIDPSAAEETCCDAGLIVAFVNDKIVAMRKLGCGMIDPGLINEYLTAAKEASVNLIELTTRAKALTVGRTA